MKAWNERVPRFERNYQTGYRWGRLIGAWVIARWQWLWCVLLRHPLTENHSVRRNNKHGQVVSTDRWMSCECGAKVGVITRQRYLHPY